MTDQASIAQSYATYGERDEQKDKKKGLFGFSQKQELSPLVGADMTGQFHDTSRRLRILEERYANQRKNIHVLEHNMLSSQKKIHEHIHSLQQDFTALKKQLYDMQQQFDMVGAALKDTAKREDVLVLEKYINLWEPLQFVTRKEVERLVEFIVEGKKK